MTATSTPPVGIDLDRPGVPFSRLVRVEARKLADTRAGKWLLGAIAVISVIAMAIVLWVALATDTTFAYADFIAAIGVPMSILLPVLGVLSVTSEWSQRTALVTFTLEPNRGRVLASKVVVGVLVGAVALVIAAVAGAIGAGLLGLLGGESVTWDVTLANAVAWYLLLTLPIMMGLAYGMLLLSSPAAIVLYFAAIFVLPGIFGTASVFLEWFADVWPWIDFGTTQAILMQSSISGEEWAQFAVSGTIWLVIPFVFGAMRVVRSEVK